MSDLVSMQQNRPDTGSLLVNVSSLISSRAVPDATIQIMDGEQPDQVIEELTTDSNGQTETIELPAPPLEYSMEPLANQPYSVFNLRISAPGYESTSISGAEILSGQTALQNITLIPQYETEEDSSQLYVIPPHTLYGEYPPKIPESEIKDVSETGEIVLSRVVIPSGVRKPFDYITNRRKIPIRRGNFLAEHAALASIHSRRINSFFPQPPLDTGIAHSLPPPQCNLIYNQNCFRFLFQHSFSIPDTDLITVWRPASQIFSLPPLLLLYQAYPPANILCIPFIHKIPETAGKASRQAVPAVISLTDTDQPHSP